MEGTEETTRKELRMDGMTEEKEAYRRIDGEVAQFQGVIKATIDAMDISTDRCCMPWQTCCKCTLARQHTKTLGRD